MPVYRSVLKTDATTTEAAVQFILDDTGGAVMHDLGFPVIDEGDSWRVPVFSLDGRPSAPLHVVRALAKLGVDSNANDLRERPYNESAGPNPTDARLAELKSNADAFYKLLRGD